MYWNKFSLAYYCPKTKGTIYLRMRHQKTIWIDGVIIIYSKHVYRVYSRFICKLSFSFVTNNIENHFVKGALANEFPPPRAMKHVEINGKEITIVNIDGQF